MAQASKFNTFKVHSIPIEDDSLCVVELSNHEEDEWMLVTWPKELWKGLLHKHSLYFNMAYICNKFKSKQAKTYTLGDFKHLHLGPSLAEQVSVLIWDACVHTCIHE